ncbi:hypothetical protein RN001_003701 [Aquatica leii]|uniref:Uncharacterized protein n=1 Tax=Aquatica leii TaxID=1421715 RepID=A0AAN7ST28_9COLE|nr:hypothetical protein RN001_003701 [Aquatica leii]
MEVNVTPVTNNKARKKERNPTEWNKNKQKSVRRKTRINGHNLIPHLNFEINVEDDSDGINLKNNAQVIQEATPGPSSASEVRPVTGTQTPKKPTVYKQNDCLNELKKARLQLIKKEETRMEELHMIRIEEAQYRREAAKFLMMQEEKKFNEMI